MSAMERMEEGHGRAAAGLAFGAACLLLLAAGPAAASPRSWQPLIVHGRQTPSLVGTRVERLEVLARRRRGGPIGPIPFEFDKVLPNGRVAAPRGPHPEPAAHPQLFGRSDQLVLMIADLGLRIRRAGDLPPGALEIELDDPLGGPPRFAYVASVASPRRSRADYVRYDARRDSIESQHYRFGMTRGNATDLALTSHMGEPAPDLIDRFKSRITARILKFFSFHMTEDDIENHLLAYRAGRLRVIRRVQESAHLGLGLSSPDVKSSDYFYRDFIKTPFHVKFPWVPSAVFGDVHVYLYYDFRNLKDFRLLDSESMPGLAQASSGGPAPGSGGPARPPQAHWLALRGHGHTLVQILMPEADARAVTRQLYYVDSSRPDPPEAIPGDRPGVGYELSGWQNLSPGPHHFESLLVNVSEDTPPQQVLREVETPPVVRVRPVSGPALTSRSAF